MEAPKQLYKTLMKALQGALSRNPFLTIKASTLTRNPVRIMNAPWTSGLY